MRITENLMTGVKRFKQPVYQASFEKSLHTVLGTETLLGRTRALTQFPGVDSYPWCINDPADKLIIKNFTPIRHRVFNTDELDFLIAYDELGELNLTILMCLAYDHDRCTFEVRADQFVSLFKQLPNLVKKYKYNSNVYNIEGNYMNLCNNYTLGISFYKMHTFLYDIYGNNPEGVGVTFEFFNKHESTYSPSIPIGYYLLLTNVYEGVFYMDGRERYNLVHTNFKHKTDYIQSMVDVCKVAINNRMAIRIPKTKNKTQLSDVDKALFSYQYKEADNNRRLKMKAPSITPEESFWDETTVEQVVEATAKVKYQSPKKRFGQYTTKVTEQQFRKAAKKISPQPVSPQPVEKDNSAWDVEKIEQAVQKYKTVGLGLNKKRKTKSKRVKIDFNDDVFTSKFLYEDDIKRKNVVTPVVHNDHTFYVDTTSATSTTNDDTFSNSSLGTYYTKKY